MTSKGFRLIRVCVRALRAAAVLSLIAVAAGMLHAQTIYTSIPVPVPIQVQAIGPEGYGFAELGDGLIFTVGTGRLLDTVKVILSTQACQSGTVQSGCVSTPGFSFNQSITVNIYPVLPGSPPQPGALLATKTVSRQIPYRPTSTPLQCVDPTQFMASDGKCYSSISAEADIDFISTMHVVLPDRVIVGISYNTTHYGPSPFRTGTTCYITPEGCPYDKLYIATAGDPLVGSSLDPNGIYVNWASSASSCTNPPAATGALLHDTGACNPSVPPNNPPNWQGQHPLIGVNVATPPTLMKQFGTPSILVGGSTSLTFTVTNTNPEASLSGIGFTDTLPGGLIISTPNGMTSSCASGSITADEGTNTITLSGTTLSAGDICTFAVNVTGIAPGFQSNSTSAVTSEAGPGSGATASIAVIPLPPTIAKAFTVASLPLGTSTNLTFTIANPNVPIGVLTGIGFTDNLPAGLEVSTPNNGLTNSCGGLITASPGSSSITLSGATLAGGTFCTISVSVTGIGMGTQANSTGPVMSNEGGNGNTATASIVVIAPPTIAKSFAVASLPLGTSTSLTFKITNPNPSVALTGIGFTDNLPAGLEVSTPNNGLSGSCGGTITATSGTSVIKLAGGVLAGGAFCTFSVSVTGIAIGPQTNATSQVTSNEGGNGQGASASTTVIPDLPPTIAKTFGASSIVLTTSTSLTFSLTNPNPSVTLTGVGFTDTLPGGLEVSTPNNGLTNSCGGLITANPGSSSITLSGATLAGGTFCTISVNVTGIVLGTQVNSAGPVMSNEGGNGNTATASVIVIPALPPTIAKSFGTASLPIGTSTSVSFTITNPNPSVTLTGIGFTDTLPAGLEVSTPNNGLTGSCGVGLISANPGGSLIGLTGATLAGGAFCTFSVSVTGIAIGPQNNVTTQVLSNEGGNGNSGTASTTVVPPTSPVPGSPFQVRYAANLAVGQESWINIINDGANGASPYGPGIGPATGNICVNVYAFAPDEELASCCSCLLTPDQVVNLGVMRDIVTPGTGLTQSLGSANSLTIKLLATLAGADGSGTSCTNSAAWVADSGVTLAIGMVAFGTTLHAAQPGNATFAMTETPFIPASLGPAELASLSARCAGIIGNLSGYGQCNSCQTGALGATKK